jgi:hypothetical protein
MPEMKPLLKLLEARGRFPEEPHAICSHQIESTVIEIEPGIVLLRLESTVAMEFWLQLMIDLRGDT